VHIYIYIFSFFLSKFTFRGGGKEVIISFIKDNLGQTKTKEYIPNFILNLVFTVISAFIAAEERTRRNKRRPNLTTCLQICVFL